MKPSFVFPAIVFALAGAACRVEPPPETDYVTRIEIARRAKDTAWQAQDTPIPKERKADFLPLL